MLFWEAMNGKRRRKRALAEEVGVGTGIRLPFDNRCRGLTKAGKRCKAKVREGAEYCIFHDPEIPSESRRRAAAKGGRSRRRLAHLPDGYLRPITDKASIGKAMDRLYREVRLGIITPQMGRVLFDILCRVLDTDFTEQNIFNEQEKQTRKGRTYRMRGKLKDLLTEQEHEAWNEAVENAPEEFRHMSDEQRIAAAFAANHDSGEDKTALPAAS
ncbi:MAG: hypothetical protein ACYTHJ_06245 [Planctomycetota bacterium]